MAGQSLVLRSGQGHHGESALAYQRGSAKSLFGPLIDRF